MTVDGATVGSSASTKRSAGSGRGKKSGVKRTRWRCLGKLAAALRRIFSRSKASATPLSALPAATKRFLQP
eukprot:6197308-Alexandrium_andersonii.AAC.1